MYTDIDYKTKKALKEAFKNGKQITVYQPGGFFPSQKDGTTTIEGPHYPKPHTWYARVELKDGVITRILG